MPPNIEEILFLGTAVYPYGSQVYGTARQDSDHDYIVVSDATAEGDISESSLTLKIISVENFKKNLVEHDISCLECIFLPSHLAADRHWDFELSLPKLRQSISAKASHSWVKAKKKMTEPYEVPDEFMRGKKSLFHSFRILYFGIQIAKFGKIVNYAEANPIWRDIYENPSTDWNHYQAKWKEQHNAVSTAFRLLAPKE